MKWQDAMDECDLVDAHLIFIESDDENLFIINLMKKELSRGDTQSDVWLGLKKENGGKLRNVKF